MKPTRLVRSLCMLQTMRAAIAAKLRLYRSNQRLGRNAADVSISIGRSSDHYHGVREWCLINLLRIAQP